MVQPVSVRPSNREVKSPAVCAANYAGAVDDAVRKSRLFIFDSHTTPLPHRRGWEPGERCASANVVRALSQLVKVNPRIPVLIGPQKFVPCDFAALICGFAAQHRGQRRIDAGGRLVVELTAGDTVDERLLLL